MRKWYSISKQDSSEGQQLLNEKFFLIVLMTGKEKLSYVTDKAMSLTAQHIAEDYGLQFMG